METKETTDEKILSANDVRQIIKEIHAYYQYIGEAGSAYGCGYNNALTKCIDILENRITPE